MELLKTKLNVVKTESLKTISTNNIKDEDKNYTNIIFNSKFRSIIMK